jgi:hypothetical protein
MVGPMKEFVQSVVCATQSAYYYLYHQNNMIPPSNYEEVNAGVVRSKHPMKSRIRKCVRIVWTMTITLVTNWMVSSFPTAHPAFFAGMGRPSQHRHELFMSSSSSSSWSSSPMNAFGPFGNFLNDGRRRNHTVAFMAPSGMDRGDNVGSSSSSRNEDDDDEDDQVAGTFRLISLDVKAIKPGGLRLFLMFYLMGTQNEPEPKTWKADQPSTDEYVIDYWFHDRSAVLSITMDQERLTIDRVGSEPSTRYLMQESVVLQGLLTELAQCVDDENVTVENRLLVLRDRNALEKYRNDLSFA